MVSCSGSSLSPNHSLCLHLNVPEGLYVCSCCYRPLCQTQRGRVQSSFGSIHKKHPCMNQALPAVPESPKDRPYRGDRGDVNQKLVRQNKAVARLSVWVVSDTDCRQYL